MLSFCIVTNQKSRINSRSLHRVIAYTMVSVIPTLMLDASHAIEVLVLSLQVTIKTNLLAMFPGGVRFHTAVVFFTQ